MNDPFFSGIISGLVTSALIFFTTVIWKRTITPWVENLLYRDAHIEGAWIGALIPYLGVEDLDRIQEEVILDAIKRTMFERIKRTANVDKDIKKEGDEEEVVPQYDKEGNLIAEIILSPSDKTKEEKPNSAPSEKRTTKLITIVKPTPIEVRIELKRTGHTIVGRAIEIGGASNVCSYKIKGEFRNLILAGTYETDSKEDIDRGSCSLMLKENGQRFEGFFSSYSDNDHSIKPMRCILLKRGHLNVVNNETNN